MNLTDLKKNERQESLTRTREGKVEITAELKNETYAIDIQAELKVDKNNLSDELSRQAARLGFYAVLAELLRSKFEHKKLDLEVSGAQLYKKHQKKLEATGTRVTEKAISSQLSLDPQFVAEKEALLKAELQYREVYALANAFSQRGMMLMSLAKLDAVEYSFEGSAVKHTGKK